MTPREQLIQEVLQAPEGMVAVLLKVLALLKRGILYFRVETGDVWVSVPESGSRPFGLCAGEFEVPDDFDAPLPDEILSLFED
ncbi:MAG: DUF2281 domain-containing protein [Synechococcales cyanobacterium CRU_2_2]|nr:DUF2281 domain-containing protein [Synechococcales cyanobacterium CRU_2_2]